MTGFTFQREYYEVIQKLKKTKDREAFSLAILEFIFEDKSPENLSEVASLAFQMVLPKISKSKNNSGRGGRPKNKIGFETVLKNENRIETELKPNKNRIETDFIKESSSPLKESGKENNTSNYKENIPPFLYPPKSGDKPKKNDKDLFLEKYSRYAGFTSDDSGIDYKVLLDEFDKSTYLRSLYTFKQVVAIYDAIVKGEFRDSPKTVNAADGRADRERWYARRRQAAEAEADKNREKVHKRFKRFGELEIAHKAIGLEIAKRELEFDKSQDGYAAQRLEEAINGRDRIEEDMAKYVAECGYTMADLLPKWHCEKCQDTGWQADGKFCDCYDKSIE